MDDERTTVKLPRPGQPGPQAIKAGAAGGGGVQGIEDMARRNLATMQAEALKQERHPSFPPGEPLPLDSIRLDGGTQARDEHNPYVVDEYAALYRHGTKLPPVVVFFDGADYWLADGFHRVLAARAAGRTKINASMR